MANPLVPYVNSGIAVSVYQNLQREIPAHIIFASMAQVAQRHNQNFVLPLSPVEYPQKHREIETQLSRFVRILGRGEFFFELLDEIFSQLNNDDNKQYIDRLLSIAVIESSNGYKIRLSPNGAWGFSWTVSLDPGDTSNQRDLLALVYVPSWGVVVPPIVLQYLSSGILLYKQKNYSAALALMTIAVEATLRDVLWAIDGYIFSSKVNKVNTYKQTKASVDKNPTGYTLSIANTGPQPPINLATSFPEALPIDIQIRRSINQSKDRVDLVILAPANVVDYLSTDEIQQEGNPKIIGGLGEALKIARNAAIITNEDLPSNVDGVLRAVRNNLIHLSSNALGEVLDDFAWKNPPNPFTLKDFVHDKDLVFDLITEIPEFVNNQYSKLWNNQLRLPEHP